MELTLSAVDERAAEPPFEQIRAQVARRAASGEFESGAKLPTVRRLAADLGVAANTAAKAYRALEADGVIETRGRHGTFIAVRRSSGDSGASTAVESLVQQARAAGWSRAQTLQAVEDAW